MTVFRVCAQFVLLLCMISQFSANGGAQAYPARVVRVIVPSTAGSGVDTAARIVAGGLADVFGQQVIVDNRTGASGNIGMEIAARAPADGYTLVIVNSGHAANVSLYRNLRYDLIRDFSPVTQLVASPNMVLAHPSLPVKSINDLVKLAKARPAAINYASAGTGSVTFLAVELLKTQAGVNMVHVPYRGGGEALTAVLAGEVSVYFGPVAASLSHVQQGRLRALAVTSAKRLLQLPELPTVAESIRSYELQNWYGLLVPAKTPRDVIATIRAAAVTALNKPDANRRLIDLGYALVGDQPEEFSAYITSEIEKLRKIIRALNLTAN